MWPKIGYFGPGPWIPVQGHYENPEIAQIILETYEEDDIKKLTGSRDGNGDTALHIAARFGSFECISLLLGWIENNIEAKS